MPVRQSIPLEDLDGRAYMNPNTTVLKGNPWILGKGLSFISHARRTSFNLTFLHGTDTP